jgi:hypothetical protein
MMRDPNHVSELMIDLYYTGDVSDEEKIIIEAELKRNSKLRSYYQELEKYDKELTLEKMPKLVNYFNSLEKAPSAADKLFGLFQDWLHSIGEIIDGTINFQPYSLTLASLGTRKGFGEEEDNADAAPAAECIVKKNESENIYEFELNHETRVKIEIPYEHNNAEYTLCIRSVKGKIEKLYNIKTKPDVKRLVITTEVLKAGKYFAAIVRNT